MFRTCPRELEVLPKGYSKGATLVRMMDMFGWDKDKVFTFGDGENDIEMFHLVGTSVAMGNADDEIKKHASTVTLTVDEDGIADFFEKEFNIK